MDADDENDEDKEGRICFCFRMLILDLVFNWKIIKKFILIVTEKNCNKLVNEAENQNTKENREPNIKVEEAIVIANGKVILFF